MIRSLFDTSAFVAARAALDGLTRRQEATASNIANVDTVGFQRKSVTFERALRDQLEAAKGVQALRTTHPAHIASATAYDAEPGRMETRDVIAARNDDNQVSIDEEMAILADTQIRYQALTQTLSGRLATLRNIIRGGR